MKDVTRPNDTNKYYIYKGELITRERHTGLYYCLTNKGRVVADTQLGIKRLINNNLNKKETNNG